uniref:Uncharacterized protein n=1 Tax=Arundo donax TaxID=35708 RepID=A0A0A9AY69_ARUDO
MMTTRLRAAAVLAQIRAVMVPTVGSPGSEPSMRAMALPPALMSPPLFNPTASSTPSSSKFLRVELDKRRPGLQR